MQVFKKFILPYFDYCKKVDLKNVEATFNLKLELIIMDKFDSV